MSATIISCVYICMYICTCTHSILAHCTYITVHLYTRYLYSLQTRVHTVHVHIHTLSVLYTSTHVHSLCTYIQTLSVCVYCIYVCTYVYTYVDTLSAFHTNACAYCVVPHQLAEVWLLLLQPISHLLCLMHNIALYSVYECMYIRMYYAGMYCTVHVCM